VTNIDQLHRELLMQLQRFNNQLDQELDVFAKITAKELVSDLKRTSPEKTGDYRKGWRVKKKGKRYIVHNATDYQLTHLLEKGHAKRGGGRVNPQVHIAPAEDKANSAFLQRIEGAINQ
jgi:hypothetical protein